MKGVQVQVVGPILAGCRGTRNVSPEGWGVGLLHEPGMVCENKVLWLSLSCGRSGHEFQCSQLCY